MNNWRYLAIGGCLIVISASVFADSLDVQRQYYLQIKQAWDDNQMTTVRQLLPKLRSYPLYSYLEYRQLSQDLSQVTSKQVTEFIVNNPTLPPARSLAPRFINELARRQDWHGLLEFSPEPPESISARCNFYYAKWATGEPKSAWKGANEIWLNGQSLPDSCSKLFTVWQKAGHQTPIIILERMHLALKEENFDLLSILLTKLPADYQAVGRMLLTLQKKPGVIEKFSRSVKPTDFTRAVVSTVFARLARQDAENAKAMIPTIARLQKMDNKQRLELEEAVAWRFMGNDTTHEQAKWRDEVIIRSHSGPLLERRARMALGNGSHQSLKRWLARLPKESMDKDEWCYWRAELLLDEGKKNEGEVILQELTKKRGFYPMVAAQKLNIDYQIMVAVAKKPDRALHKLPEIARIRELMYWNMDILARTEWRYLVASRSQPEQTALARYAYDHKWIDMSVQATIVAKLWDHLEERFPLGWPQEFHKATAEKSITSSYAMAIARQESAWNPKAQSPVGAVGLMQIMPRTAEYTVKMSNISGYFDSKQLFDPITNINIGTGYLEFVYRMFGRNRILSSAAYNAGPSRVNAWLKKSEGKINAIAFIESIPFSETRSYVKNVLAYDAFYRHFMRQPSKVLSDEEWQRNY